MEKIFCNKEELEYQQEIREFLMKELAPIKEKINQNKEIPLDLYRKMGRKGLFGPLIPEDYNGNGKGMIAHVIITEEISRLNVAVSVMRTPCILDSYTIFKHGNEYQKDEFLKKIVSGEKIASICITEENAGSNVAGMSSYAVKDGNEYILNGKKKFITNAGIADYYLIWCITDKKVNPRNGISIFLVEKDTPGLEIERPYGLLGLNGVMNGIVKLTDVRVPKDNLIGPKNRGYQILMNTFNVERITLSSECNGISLAVLDDSKKYAMNREQFGKKLVEFQTIRTKIAEIATKLQAARSLTYGAAKLAMIGEEYTKEASMAKVFSSKVAVEIALEGIQIHGGNGYTNAYPMERYLRDAKFFQIGGGTSEIQILIIAREELKKFSK
ncbi:MAG: acyl-CoA dehydrogenase family protein [Candidatus Helarchaeota archaeon]